MSQTLEQHQLVAELLELFDLTHIRLEKRDDGTYTFTAWDTPVVETNGGAKTVKRGRVRIRKKAAGHR